jgi:pilus assembly protein CpaE
MSESKQITILLVDDIPETRENIKKLLAFEPDMRVVGTAGTGREGIDMAKEFKPDIIIMDINMPDMDGLQATSFINKAVPRSAVIMMSVQDDMDYVRRAMSAGARDFLTKPVNMDELYNTIRKVYTAHEAYRKQYDLNLVATPAEALQVAAREASGERSGHIIVVYSPQGGAGTSTIATNLASGLLKDGTKVLLVDADLQFGDVPTFLNLQSQTTLVDLVEDVDDLDPEHFDNIVVTHESGLKVLIGPQRPEFADEVRAKPGVVATILQKVNTNYDFVVVDTSCTLDDVTLSLFDVASRIIMVTTPSLTAVKNTKFVLDLFEQLQYPPEKAMIVLNKAWSERERKQATLAPDRIQNFLKRPIAGEIPVVDERIILSAILRGVPVIAADRNQSNPPTRQILDLAGHLYQMLEGSAKEAAAKEEAAAREQAKKKSGLSLRLSKG